MGAFKNPDDVKRALEKTGSDSSWMYPDGQDTAGMSTQPAFAPLDDSLKIRPQNVSFQASEQDPAVSMEKVPAVEPPPAAPEAPIAAPRAPRAHRQPAGEPSLDSYLKPEFRGKQKAVGKQIEEANLAQAGQGAPAPAADPLPENPYPAPARESDGVEDLPFNVTDKTKSLQTQVAMGNARKLDQLSDEAAGVEDATAKGQAVEQARAAQAQEDIEGRKTVQAENIKRDAEMRARQEDEMAALKEKMGHPPFDTVGMVFGLVSALAAAHGKPAAGKAFEMMGQAVNTRMQRWQGEVEGGREHVEGMGKLVNQDHLKDMDHEQAQAAITKAVGAEFDSALDAVGAQAKSEHQVRAVEQLKNQVRQSMASEELGRRAKAEAARRKAEAYQRIGRAKTEEEAQGIATQYGELGNKVNRDIIHTQKDRVGVAEGMQKAELTGAQTEATRAEVPLKEAQARKADADAEKAANAAKGGNEGPSFGKYTLPGNLPSGLVTEVGKGATAMSGVQTAYKRLIQLAEDVKNKKISSIDANTAGEIEDLRNQLVSQKTQINGAGAPTGKEFDQTIATIADPQKFMQRADSLDLLKRSLANTQRSWHNRMEELHATPYQPGAPKGNANGEVKVVSPDGQSISVSRSVATAMRKTNPELKIAGEDEEGP